MTNFLLFCIVVILACIAWGTKVVAGTVLAAVVLVVIGALFVRSIKYIINGY